MNTLLLNNYIQYLNRNGHVKTKSVDFLNNGTKTTFEVKGISEDYFILSVFQNNIKVVGVGFENTDNTDMLAFINSDFVDLNVVPQSAFFTPEKIVVMSYNNEYLAVKTGQSTFTNPIYNRPLFGFLIPEYITSATSLNIKGVSLDIGDINNSFNVSLFDFDANANMVVRNTVTGMVTYQVSDPSAGIFEYEYKGFLISTNVSLGVVKLLIDEKTNFVGIQASYWDMGEGTPLTNCFYYGFVNGFHQWVLTDSPTFDDAKNLDLYTYREINVRYNG